MATSKRPIVDSNFLPKLRSARHAAARGQGEWGALTNTRFDDGLLKCRYGTALVGTIGANHTFKGRFVAPNGTIYVAARISGETRVYKSTNGASWVEITEASGPYGNTRISQDEPVWFSLVKDRFVSAIEYPSSPYTSNECLVFGSETSAPRVYGYFFGGSDPSLQGEFHCAPVAEIAPPMAAATYAVHADPFANGYSGMELADPANTAYYVSDADITFADTGAASANTARITIGAATDNGDWCIIEDTAGARAMLVGRQLLLGIDTSYSLFLEAFKIEVGTYSGGSFTSAATVWNPEYPTTTVNTIPLGLSSAVLYAFDVAQFYTTSTYDAIKFTFVGSAPSSSQTIDLFLAGPGAIYGEAVPGGTSYAISLFNVGSHTESRAVVLPTPETKASIVPWNTSWLGQYYVAAQYLKYKIPYTSDLYYHHNVPVPNPSTTDRDLGIEAVRIYRKRPSDEDYVLTTHFTTCKYNAGWSIVSGSPGSFRLSGDLATESATQLKMPNPFMIPIPKIKAMIMASGRLIVSTTANLLNVVLGSEQDCPFRFQEIPEVKDGQIVESSAFAINTDSDKIIAFAPVAGSMIGANTCYMVGGADIYAIGGIGAGSLSQAARLGLPGSASPRSVFVARDGMVYLDNEGQMRRVRVGQNEYLTAGTVDDVTKNLAATRVPYVAGCYHNERMYVPLSPTGASTNTKILVWSDRIGDWCSLDTPPIAFDDLFSWYDENSGRARLIGIGLDGTTLKAYEYDYSGNTQDLGSNIAIAGTSYIIRDREWNELTAGRAEMLCDQVSGGATFTTVRSYTQDAGTMTDIMAIPAGSNVARLVETGPGTIVGKGRGAGCLVSFSATVRGGWTCLYYALSVEDSGEGRSAS